MKHRVSVTLEIILWMFLGVWAAILMGESSLVKMPSSVGASWVAAVQILAAILIGAVATFFIVKYIGKAPKWVRYCVGILIYLVLVFVATRSAFLGVQYLYDAPLSELWMLPILAVFGFVIWAVAKQRKGIWWLVLRLNTVLMLLVLGAASAMLSLYLTPVWVVALLAAIAVYDAVAVWVLGTMQNMVGTLKTIGFLPAITVPKADGDIGLLGGGDVAFISIVTLVFARSTPFGAAVCTGMLGAVVALFFASERKKSYPAIPFIFAGMAIGLLVGVMLL